MERAALRLLLLEDDPADADIAQIILRRKPPADLENQVQIRVTHVDSLNAAVAAAQDQEFDVALLDLKVRDSSGVDTYARFRGAHPQVPVVVVTGTQDARTLASVFEAGARDFVSKVDGLSQLPVAVYLSVLRNGDARSIESRRAIAAELAIALAEARDARREVDALNQRLRKQNLALDRAMEANSRFLANVSHELRNPLSGIVGYSYILANEELGHLEPKQRQFAQNINDAAKHLTRLIDDVLDLSKVESGMMRFYPEEVTLEELVSKSVTFLQPQIEAAGTHVETIVDEAVVHTDPARARQMIVNYLSNAIKFSPGGSTVRVEATVLGSDWRVCVTDQGPGLDPKQQKQVFERFTQLDDSRAKHGEGTGLGLTLVREVARQQGGTVGVDSTPGQGATFWFSVPCTPPKGSA